MTQSAAARRTDGRNAGRGARVLPSRCKEMVEFIFEHRRATADQLRRKFFSPGAASRMRHWLAVLRRGGYVEHVAHRRVSDAAVYKVGARSHRGLALLRETYGDTEVRRRASAYVQDEHYVLITECYIAIWQAVVAAGWELLDWQDAIDLRARTGSDGLIPDAFFRIERPDGSKACFFLELERAAKSDQSLRRKLEQHRNFYRTGRYEELFDSKSLRVLFVMVSSMQSRRDPAEKIMRLSETVGATFVCSVLLTSVLQSSQADLLVRPLWRRAGHPGGYALFKDSAP